MECGQQYGKYVKNIFVFPFGFVSYEACLLKLSNCAPLPFVLIHTSEVTLSLGKSQYKCYQKLLECGGFPPPLFGQCLKWADSNVTIGEFPTYIHSYIGDMEMC